MEDWPCPLSSEIKPCHCYVGDDFKIGILCDGVVELDEITRIFSAQFPFNTLEAVVFIVYDTETWASSQPIKIRDVNEPLQARGSTRSARKFRCSNVARLEIGLKIFGSIFARLEKCSKNFGSRSTLFEIFRLEMLASLKRANFWKKLQGIYCQYCT